MYAVIMAGGKGERLWPKSTRLKAKHVLSFGTRNVMIQETINRLKAYLPLENIYLVTTKSQYPTLKQYASLLKKGNIILEPEGRDTAAAICLSALTIEKKHGDSTMVVLPTDHIINTPKLFFKSLALADRVAQSNSALVTIGVKPKYPSIGYGYIEVGKKERTFFGAYKVKRFIEKPKKDKAEKIYKKKNYLWNSGIFVWKTSAILSALKKHMPDLYYALKDTIKYEGQKGYSLRLSSEYSSLKKISIDYGVIEPAARYKSLKLLCVKAGFDWVDIGSWSSVEEIYDKDKFGNIVLSNSSLIDVRNSTIIGERGYKIGVIGVKDLIIVQTTSGTLVCSRDRAQEVKDLVKNF